MSTSIRVSKVRINSSTVQSVMFRAMKNGDFHAATRGQLKLKIVVNPKNGKYVVRDGLSSQIIVSALTPDRAFAKAVNALWN